MHDSGHEKLIHFFEHLFAHSERPKAIVVISAHWETAVVTITSQAHPPLIYDYDGFPRESYDINYPLQGDPLLAEKMYRLLCDHGIDAKLDAERGVDHGVFVPLKLMLPHAQIPCVQLSLLSTLDPESHIAVGNALQALRDENILFIGSGFSFHNLPAFFAATKGAFDEKNAQFQDWLIEVCTNPLLTKMQRKAALVDWKKAPFASYCHPREEHLIPLHVCAGLSNANASVIFDDMILGKRACAFLWRD